MRKAELKRKTEETDIKLTLTLDGSGTADIQTGIGFLDHMLTLWTRHGLFDLQLRCKGDTRTDDHHSTEDIGIVLGKAFREALGDGAGINRYADSCLPMDEALVQVAADISGRGAVFADLSFPTEKVGSFDTELVQEFLTAFAQNAGITLHVRILAGRNSHHMIEAIFKALGRVLDAASRPDPRLEGLIPSSKGLLL